MNERHIWQLKPFFLRFELRQLHRSDTFSRDIVYFPWNGNNLAPKDNIRCEMACCFQDTRRKEKQESCCTIDLGDSLFTELARLEVEKRKKGKKEKEKENDERG